MSDSPDKIEQMDVCVGYHGGFIVSSQDVDEVCDG